MDWRSKQLPELGPSNWFKQTHICQLQGIIYPYWSCFNFLALIIYFYKKKHKSTEIVLDNENRPEESGINEENSEAQEGNQGGDEQNTQQASQGESGLEEQTSLEVVSETTDRQALLCPAMGQLSFSGVNKKILACKWNSSEVQYIFSSLLSQRAP